MALFGFGKKKEPAPAPKPEQKKTEIKGDPSEYLIQVDGQWFVNPDYDPNAAKEKKKTAVVTSSWVEDVDTFLARSRDAKLFKLTGKQDDLAFYSVGSRCHVEEDEDNPDKYNVTCDHSIIGRLPASAITYAKKIGSLPEHLSVIIAEIDYDIEKDRDIISVYIA